MLTYFVFRINAMKKNNNKILKMQFKQTKPHYQINFYNHFLLLKLALPYSATMFLYFGNASRECTTSLLLNMLIVSGIYATRKL